MSFIYFSCGEAIHELFLPRHRVELRILLAVRMGCEHEFLKYHNFVENLPQKEERKSVFAAD